MLRRSKQVDPMSSRWQLALLMAATAGVLMLLENSRRLDTGAPDVELTASRPPTVCVLARMAAADDADAVPAQCGGE